WANPFDVGDVERLAPGVMDDGPWEPSNGEKSFELRTAGIEGDDSDGVLSSVANIKLSPGRIKGERVRAGAEKVTWFQSSPNGFDQLIGAGIDHAEGISGGIGDYQVPSFRREGHRRGVETCGDLGEDLIGSQINDCDRAFIGDESLGVNPHQGAAPGRADDAGGVRPAPTPVA